MITLKQKSIKKNNNNKLENFDYEDITNKILKKAVPNFNIIKEVSKFKEYNITNTNFDNKGISTIERLTLNRIQNKIGGIFLHIHRIQNDKINTPDSEYRNSLLFSGKKYFEIKAPKRSISSNSKKKKISRQFDEARKQSNNIIISLLRKECDITNNEAEKQIINCLSNKRYSSWIEIVILVGKHNFIRVYTKKKRP